MLTENDVDCDVAITAAVEEIFTQTRTARRKDGNPLNLQAEWLEPWKENVIPAKFPTALTYIVDATPSELGRMSAGIVNVVTMRVELLTHLVFDVASRDRPKVQRIGEGLRMAYLRTLSAKDSTANPFGWDRTAPVNGAPATPIFWNPVQGDDNFRAKVVRGALLWGEGQPLSDYIYAVAHSFKIDVHLWQTR